MSRAARSVERYPTTTAAEILAADDEEGIREMVRSSLNREFDVIAPTLPPTAIDSIA